MGICRVNGKKKEFVIADMTMTNSKNHRVYCAFVICCLLSSYPSHSFADDFTLEPTARYRYQSIDDSARFDAKASTLKLRLTADWQASDNWHGLAQVDYVHAFNENDYNSVTITRATSPIPDVKGGELNQLWLKYKSDNDWDMTLGRQMLSFDNDRHVSSLEYWQNDQTFDALKFNYNDSINWDVSFAYVSKVHRIFGDDATRDIPINDIRFGELGARPFLELGNHDHNSQLLNVKYNLNPFLSVSGYAYIIENKSAQQLSSNTFGVRIDGEVKPGTIKYGYTLDVAHQNTTNDSPWNYEGHYLLAEVSAQYKSHQLSLSHEHLSENNGFAFATSLGDNHKFFGWADIFSSYLNTDGIKDTYPTLRGRDAKLRWRVVAHQFTSDLTGDTAGHELDIEVAYRFDRKWESSLLFSRYVPDAGIAGLPASQNDLTSVVFSVSYNL